MDIVQAHLAGDDLQLPVFNRTALQLQKAMSQPDFSMEKCAALISHDQALASQVLKEANSSFYSGLKKVTTIRDAMIRLGAKEVLNLTMTVTQRNQYQCRHPGLRRLVEKLWRHSLGVAVASQWLARQAGYQAQAQEAFLAGLLHDIGRLFLLRVLDEMAAKNLMRMTEPLVMEVLDAMHVEQGHKLMTKWGLPELYCEIVRLHHSNAAEGETTVLLLVQLANQACHKLGLSLRPDPDLVLATTREAQALDIREIALAELEIMLEDKFMPKAAATS